MWEQFIVTSRRVNFDGACNHRSQTHQPNYKQTLIAEAIVDTGATFTTIPQTISRKLKLPTVARRKVRTASGEETLTESYLIIEILNEKTATPVLINPKLDRVLIGVITLEALALKVDPKTGKLEKTELLLL